MLSKKRTLLYLIYFWGIVSLLIFVVTRSEYLMSKLTIMGEPYGNLYKNCKVANFKIPIEPTKAPPAFFNKTPVNECDIIVLGDSHMRTWPGRYWFPVELQMYYDRPVFHMKIMRDTFKYLNKSGIQPVKKRRICILESGEARIFDRYFEIPDMKPVDPEPITEIMFGIGEEQPTLMKIRNRWFDQTERNYSFFVKNNVIFQSVIEFYYTSLFKYFGKISELTPVYSLDPPFLFEHQQVSLNRPSSYFYFHDNKMIAQIADNVKIICDSLSSMYNLEMIFFPTPNTMTLHHDIITDREYDEYLPRLCDAVEEKGVPVIRVYELYLESDELLFLPTDNHWNAKGAEIAFNEIVKAVNEKLRIIDGEAVEQIYSGLQK